MYYKCGLSIRGVIYDATEDLKNWDEVKMTLSRKDYGGTVRSFTNAFTFIGDSYARLLEEYRAHGLEFSASVAFYTRTNSWGWKEEFIQKLDVSTLNYTAYELSVNAVDDSVEAIIKAGKGTQYEYSVENYQDEMKLLYDGIEMTNTVAWDISGEEKDNGNVEITYSGSLKEILFYVPMFIIREDYMANRYVNYSDSGYGTMPTDASEAECFVRATGPVTVYPNIRFDVTAIGNGDRDYPLEMFIARCNGSTYELINKVTLQWGEKITYEVANIGISLVEGEGLVLAIKGSVLPNFSLLIGANAASQVVWKSRRQSIMLPVVSPTILLNALLKSMNGGKDGLTGRIEFLDLRGQGTRLLAAESIRNINGAKLYSSFQQFCEWMSAVFGMVYYVKGNEVIFVHRSRLYDNVVQKEVQNSSNFTYSVNKSLIYSQINVGYDKKDYDSTNGRYEFNSTTYYETGLSLTDNKLELKSPYRADCYGVEFLADTRGSETSDTDSDNDLFFVNVVIDGNNYEVDRSVQSTGLPSGVFNLRYTPRSCVLANQELIGASANRLVYTSSDGNSDITVDGVSEKSEITITDKIYGIGEIQFETDDLQLPLNWNGLIELEQNGVTYRGYLTELDKTYTREEAVSYKLIESKV